MNGGTEIIMFCYIFSLQLLLTYENELSTMKKDLANKDRMLSMYENSMADLSSKVHHLKKTLEEKVGNILVTKGGYLGNIECVLFTEVSFFWKLYHLLVHK